MSTAELHLALLAAGPRHGYDVKREHDSWFPQTRPLAYGQVYATLGRLVRDGLAEVIDEPREAGHDRTVYAVTPAGLERLRSWLAEPAPPAGTGAEDVVRKTVVAIRAPDVAADGMRGARDIIAQQRANHLRLMRALQEPDGGENDVARRLVKRHALLHLDADLRWLDEAADILAERGELGKERTRRDQA